MATFMPRATAAKMLGVSTRSVYRLVNRGLLRPARQGREAGVLEEDVVRVQRARATAGEDLPSPINKATINMLLARVRGLEHRMGVVLKFIGLNRDPLELSDLELNNLHRAALESAEKGWAPHAEQMWADTLCRIAYGDLLRIADLASMKQPWLAFLKLACTMRLACYDKTLGPTLDEAYSNIEGLSFVFGQAHGCSAKEIELAAKQGAKPRGVLLRQLQRAQEQHDGSPPPELRASSGPPA
jgi:hypothetical protein